MWSWSCHITLENRYTKNCSDTTITVQGNPGGQYNSKYFCLIILCLCFCLSCQQDTSNCKIFTQVHALFMVSGQLCPRPVVGYKEFLWRTFADFKGTVSREGNFFPSFILEYVVFSVFQKLFTFLYCESAYLRDLLMAVCFIV